MHAVALDLETTGLYPLTDAILAMAVVDHDGHVLLHTLVRPVRQHTAWPDAEAIHGMTSHDGQYAPILDTFQHAATPPTPLQRWAPQLLDGGWGARTSHTAQDGHASRQRRGATLRGAPGTPGAAHQRAGPRGHTGWRVHSAPARATPHGAGGPGGCLDSLDVVSYKSCQKERRRRKPRCRTVISPCSVLHTRSSSGAPKRPGSSRTCHPVCRHPSWRRPWPKASRSPSR